MLADLPAQPADQILALMTAFRDDPRSDKLDLGVGVYRDATGRTPIMRAVREAERRLWERATTKGYVALGGDPAFAAALGELILGPAIAPGRRAAIATPGGTGALRQAIELHRVARPGARVWVPDPTWPNHLSILRAVGREVGTFRHLDAATGGIDMPGMLADLGRAAAGDAVLLHACCHNPTGADPDAAGWRDIAATLRDREAIAIVDCAYLGFGDGLEADAGGVRTIAATLPETMICVSCSKNFGLYRDRAGLLVVLSEGGATHRAVQANLEHLNRQAYSFPPDHGARIVTMILDDPDLRADWQTELGDMREGMRDLRHSLTAELRRRTGTERFDALSGHRGMFSRLGLTPDEVATLRDAHGIYMVGDSRINVAGLSADTIPTLARAVARVCS